MIKRSSFLKEMGQYFFGTFKKKKKKHTQMQPLNYNLTFRKPIHGNKVSLTGAATG